MANVTLKHYVEFSYPGAFFSESSARVVSERDPSKVRAPKECFGYRFFDRQEAKAEDGEVLVGQARNQSGMHYFGKVMTLEDVQREMPQDSTLVQNMKGNGWKKVVKTRFGHFQPFESRDTIVSAS